MHTSEIVRITDTVCTSGAHTTWGEAESVGAPQLILLRRGVFAIRGPRGAVTADTTTALLMNGGEPYEVRHPLPGGDHCTALAYDEATIEDALSAEGGTRDAVAVRTVVSGPFVRPHRSLSIDALVRHALLVRALAARSGATTATVRVEAATPSAGDTLAIDEHALDLLGAVLRTGSGRGAAVVPRRTRTARRWIDAVEAVRLHLAARPGDNESLAALARRVHTSPYHLSRVFRWHTGASIHEYRTRLRIAAALHALAARDTDVTTLALALGFASHSHFTERFRALTGLTPSAFRDGPISARN